MKLTPPKERLIRLLLVNPGSYVGYRTKVFNAQDIQIGKVAPNTVESLWHHNILERVSRDVWNHYDYNRLKRPAVRYYVNPSASEVTSLKPNQEVPVTSESQGPVTMWDFLHDGVF